MRVLRTPELRPAPEVFEPARAVSAQQNIRVGSFRRPKHVPEYGILEETRVERDGARAVRLLVDTRSRSEEDFTLIARDLKARYARLDAISVEFTDSATILDYNGAALIFNTPAGAYYMGYVHGPPNNRGFVVDAAE